MSTLQIMFILIEIISDKKTSIKICVYDYRQFLFGVSSKDILCLHMLHIYIFSKGVNFFFKWFLIQYISELFVQEMKNIYHYQTIFKWFLIKYMIFSTDGTSLLKRQNVFFLVFVLLYSIQKFHCGTLKARLKTQIALIENKTFQNFSFPIQKQNVWK